MWYSENRSRTRVELQESSKAIWDCACNKVILPQNNQHELQLIDCYLLATAIILYLRWKTKRFSASENNNKNGATWNCAVQWESFACIYHPLRGIIDMIWCDAMCGVFTFTWIRELSKLHKRWRSRSNNIASTIYICKQQMPRRNNNTQKRTACARQMFNAKIISWSKYFAE